MVIDAHVHLLPDRLIEAIRRWFDEHAWNIRYRDGVEACIAQLKADGIERMVTLPYAHKPGMAVALNDFSRELGERHPEVVPCCTVFPGEQGARAMLDRALSRWARGVKIHCHVMKIAPDDPRLDDVWRASAEHRKPVTIHCGPEPSLGAGYGIDTRTVSGAHRLRRALERHPDAIVIVPHLGVDEEPLFEAMLADFPNLYLDTTMMLSGFFERWALDGAGILRRHPKRILYGTDFPNIPYESTRELENIRALKLAGEADILGGNAARLFGPWPRG